MAHLPQLCFEIFLMVGDDLLQFPSRVIFQNEGQTQNFSFNLLRIRGPIIWLLIGNVEVAYCPIRLQMLLINITDLTAQLDSEKNYLQAGQNNRLNQKVRKVKKRTKYWKRLRNEKLFQHNSVAWAAKTKND